MSACTLQCSVPDAHQQQGKVARSFRAFVGAPAMRLAWWRFVCRSGCRPNASITPSTKPIFSVGTVQNLKNTSQAFAKRHCVSTVQMCIQPFLFHSPASATAACAHRPSYGSTAMDHTGDAYTAAPARG
eukprot:1161133-Pelagomonas_calceolata.AAC.14